MSSGSSPSVLCFGEMLWDALPRGLFPGGAPMNVAYHLARLAAAPIEVTAVGRDQLGDELVPRVKLWNVETIGVGVSANKPTGLSRVTLEHGSPTFEIVEDVAWDWIEVSAAVLERAPRAAAVVFGSLAQRSEHNRGQLDGLLDRCPAALRVVDMNLRPPYDSLEHAWSLARRADLIKLNDHELSRLLGEPVAPAGMQDAVGRFAARAGAGKVCLTSGAAGAGLLLDGQWCWEPARPVPVRDTVGAGDSFLAALLCGLLQGGKPPAEVLRRASRLAELVVSQDGATPAYRVDDDGNVSA